jgi:hypothetical protein
LAIDWEQTFRNWSKPSSDTEAEKQDNACRMVSDAISEYKPLNVHQVRVITQGSYRNNTNVRQESDVDICVYCTDVFFDDYTFADYESSATGNTVSPYSFSAFKSDVQAALKIKFGADGVTRGNKAFDVHPTGYRVDADVVAAFAYRRYEKSEYNPILGRNLPKYVQPVGTKFISDTGSTIINWPEQHYANGAAKNGRTGNRFKYIVRALKRLKYYMIEKKIAGMQSIPSYLIECMVYNVPDSLLDGDSYEQNVRDVIGSAYNAANTEETRKKLREVNELKYLFHSSQPWTHQQAIGFAQAAWSTVGFQ